MTHTEAFRKECEEIQQRTGHYIPPYRMAALMKIAQKVTEMLCGDVCTTYAEQRLVLRIVSTAIDHVAG